MKGSDMDEMKDREMGVAEKAHNRQAHIYSLGGQVERNQGSHRAQWRSIVRHTRNTIYRSKSSD